MCLVFTCSTLHTPFSQLSEATDEKQVQNIAVSACDALLECGFTKPLSTLKCEDVTQLISNAILHSTILKIKCELDQFIEGIREAGVLHSIQKYPHYFLPLFVLSGTAIRAD